MAGKTAAQVVSTAKGAVAIPAGQTSNYTVTGSSNGGKTLMGIPKPIQTSTPVTSVAGNTPANSTSTAVATPLSTVEYNPDGTRKLATTQLDKYWQDNALENDATYQTRIGQIKADNLARQQKSIDAINSMYVNILGQANIENQNRANQTSVVNALSGLRGSNVGAANDANTAAANEQHLSAVEAEKQQKAQGIMDSFNNQLQDELQFQENLRRSDRNAWLQYMQSDMGPDARRKDMADNIRKQLITAGVDPTAVTADQWKMMADAAGMDVDQFKTIYKAEHTQNQASLVAANAKSALEREKLKAETAKLAAEAGQNLGGGLKASDFIAKGDRYISSLDEYKKLVGQGYDQYNDFTFLPDHRIFLKADNSKAYEKKKATDKKYVVRSGSGTEKYTMDPAMASDITSKIQDGATLADLYVTYPDVPVAEMNKQWATANKLP